MRLIFILFISTLFSFSFGQKEKTSEAYFNRAALEYINKNDGGCKSTLKEGLAKYPNDAHLIALAKKVGLTITKPVQTPYENPDGKSGYAGVDEKNNAGDTKPDNNSNYNNQNQYEEEAITIQINLEMTKQNEFRWNPEIQKYASRIMIVFETGSQEGSLTDDVTGTSYYKFHSGNPKFDGVKTRVTLKITPKGKVQFNGQNSIKVKTTC